MEIAGLGRGSEGQEQQQQLLGSRQAALAEAMALRSGPDGVALVGGLAGRPVHRWRRLAVDSMRVSDRLGGFLPLAARCAFLLSGYLWQPSRCWQAPLRGARGPGDPQGGAEALQAARPGEGRLGGYFRAPVVAGDARSSHGAFVALRCARHGTPCVGAGGPPAGRGGAAPPRPRRALGRQPRAHRHAMSQLATTNSAVRWDLRSGRAGAACRGQRSVEPRVVEQRRLLQAPSPASVAEGFANAAHCAEGAFLAGWSVEPDFAKLGPRGPALRPSRPLRLPEERPRRARGRGALVPAVSVWSVVGVGPLLLCEPGVGQPDELNAAGGAPIGARTWLAGLGQRHRGALGHGQSGHCRVHGQCQAASAPVPSPWFERHRMVSVESPGHRRGHLPLEPPRLG
mmetsp:Transcript_55371/g.161629  ORF Transcript_55371/g.161629 Transcript_55371/m.161629 type:complete len:399 (-) Transcript_55371:474-1670(-)